LTVAAGQASRLVRVSPDSTMHFLRLTAGQRPARRGRQPHVQTWRYSNVDAAPHAGDQPSVSARPAVKDRGKNYFRICSYRRQTVDWQIPTVWRP
jgi:hypothetical protein